MNGSTSRRIAERLFTACGIWLIGLGLYFIFVRPVLLPEDLRFMGVEPRSLQAAAPGLAAWLGKVFTVMGGFMAGAGVLTAYVGQTVLPVRPRGAALALALTGGLTAGLMSAVNFVLHSDFRWPLSAPALAWAVACALYALGGRQSGPG